MLKGVNTGVLGAGLILLASIGCVPATAQRVSIDAALHTAEKPYVQASGEAAVSVKPDQAVIEIGVISQASTAADVAAQNAKQTDAVLADLARLLGGRDKLKTTIYSVRPDYKLPKPGAAAVIYAYSATNIVEVTLDDFAQVGKVVDSASQSGANVIQGLQYRLKNPNTVRAQALRQAAEQAKLSAEAIASGLGLRVIGVLSAEELTSDEEFGMHKKAPPPPPMGAAPPTPLEVGMIDVEVSVIVRVEVGQ